METFAFTHGSTTYTYTTEAHTITRTAITSGMASGGEGLQITVPNDNPVAVLFRHRPPSIPVTVMVTDSVHGQVWSGSVLQVRHTADGAELQCVDALDAAKRLMNPQRYSRNCRHILYGVGCGVNKNLHKTTSKNITFVDGPTRQITVDTDPINADYIGGVLEGPDGVTAQIVEVKVSGPNTLIKLMEIPSGFIVGASVVAYKGCDKSAAICNSRFANIANFGGFPAIESSPFGRDVGMSEGEQ